MGKRECFGIFWICKENSYYAQNLVNGSILGPNLTLKFSLNLFISSFWSYTWWLMIGMKKWFKITVFNFFKESFYYAKDGINE